MTITAHLEALIGGRQVLPRGTDAPMQWIALIREGIPAASIDALCKTLRIKQSDLAATLGIPERTLARRKKEGQLHSDESAKLIRLARVVGRAHEVFEDLDAGLDWLKSRNAALSGATPLSLLDTDIGAEAVLDTLGRIEHGVFA